MGKMKPLKMWAVASRHGLYIGTRYTRAEMIAEHVSYYEEGLSPFVINGLSDKQRAAWKKRRKAGDRCIPVTVTPRPPRRKRS